MTGAPEKIWARVDWDGTWDGQWCNSTSNPGLPPAEYHAYTRTDLAEDAERAAYLRGLEDAERKVRELAAMEDAGYGVSLEMVYAAIGALAKEGGK